MKNMHIKIVVLVAWTLALLPSCRQDAVVFVPYETSVDDMALRLSATVPDGAAQTTFALKGSTSDTILTTASGLRVWLADMDNLFTDAATGQPIQWSTAQNVRVEIIEARSIAEIIGHSIATISDGLALENGGMVRLRITLDGKEISLKPGEYLKVQLPVGAQNELVADQKIFYGRTVSNGATDWFSMDETAYWANWPLLSGGEIYGYELRCTRLGWVGSARLAAGSTTNFCASAPTDFNGQNTFCWMVVPQWRAVLPMDGFLEAGKFCFPDAPLGSAVKMVMVSRIAGQWFLAHADTVVGSEGSLDLAPASSSEAEVVAFLKNL